MRESTFNLQYKGPPVGCAGDLPRLLIEVETDGASVRQVDIPLPLPRRTQRAAVPSLALGDDQVSGAEALSAAGNIRRVVLVEVMAEAVKGDVYGLTRSDLDVQWAGGEQPTAVIWAVDVGDVNS